MPSGFLSGTGTKTKPGIVALLGIIATIYVFALTTEPDLQPELNPDSSTFLVLAKSLASGQGYRNIDLVCNTPHGHFPFVFPVLLMPFVYFYGFNVLILKGFVTVLALSAFSCLALLFVRYKMKHTIPVLLLSMVSFWIFRFSHAIMSEVPYILFSILAVFFTLRYQEQKSWLSMDGFLMVAFLVLVYFSRSIGISLVVAATCALVFGIEPAPGVRNKKAVFTIIVFGVFALACRISVYGNLHPTGGSYLNEFFIDPYDKTTGLMNLSNMIQRLFHNIYALFFYGFPNILTGMQFKARNVLSIALLSFTAAGFITAYKKNKGVIEWYLVCYLLILVVWPWTRHHGTRFLIPVTPFVFYYFLTGVSAAGKLFPAKKIGSALYIAAFALLVAVNSVSTCRFIVNECGKVWSEKPSGKYIEMAKWIKERSPKDATFITWSSQTLYVWSQRKCVCLPGFATVSDLEKIIRENRGSCFVSDPVNDPELFQTVINHDPELFSEQYNKGGLKVFKIR